MWWELTSGGHANAEQVRAVVIVDLGGGSWILSAKFDSAHSEPLKGSYASLAAAKTAARELTQGIDPITVTGGS